MLPQPKGYSKLPLLMLVVQAVEVVGGVGGARGDTAAREPRVWACPLLARRVGRKAGGGCMRATARPRSTARGLRRKILLGLGYFTVWFLITPT